MSGLSSDLFVFQERAYLRLWREAMEVAENLTRLIRVELAGEMGHRCAALFAHMLDASTQVGVSMGAKIFVTEGGHILEDKIEAKAVLGSREWWMAILSMADNAEPAVQFVSR